MAGEPLISQLIGSTTKEASINFTPSGKAVCNVDIAVNPRRKNSSTGEWEEQPAQFYRVAVWGDMAEHVAGTLNRSGIRVVVSNARVTSIRTYEKRDGGTGVSIELDADEVSPSLRFNPVAVPPKGDRGGSGGGQRPQRQESDPWATGPGQYDDSAAPF